MTNFLHKHKSFFPSGNYTLYGGDLVTLFDLMETSLKNFQLQTSSSLYSEDQSRLKVCVEHFDELVVWYSSSRVYMRVFSGAGELLSYSKPPAPQFSAPDLAPYHQN